MIAAGRCQDKIGPRKTAIIGGMLVGLGFILISQTTLYVAWVLGFGVIAGTAILILLVPALAMARERVATMFLQPGRSTT